MAPCEDSLSLRLTYIIVLNLANKSNSQVHYAKGTPSQHIAAPTACKHMVSGSISLLCSRFFSPFPHGTGSLSVSGEYLALADGPARFTQGFSCPALLRILVGLIKKSCTGLSPSMIVLSKTFHFPNVLPHPSPTTPVLPKQCRFGLFPVRSPLLRESLLFYIPMGTQMFQFPTFASSYQLDDTIFSYQVAPFGYLRIDSYLPIPAAFRSLSRPSSPSRAQASSMCPYSLSFLAFFRLLFPFVIKTSLFSDKSLNQKLKSMYGQSSLINTNIIVLYLFFFVICSFIKLHHVKDRFAYLART